MGRIEYEYPLFKVYYSNNSNNSNIRGNPARELRANSVGIARFSDSDSFPIHFFSRPDIKLNPFDSDRPCTRLCRHNKVGPGHLLKFSLNSIPKSAVFRAFLTEFSLNSISKIICLFAGHLLKEESQPSPDSD